MPFDYYIEGNNERDNFLENPGMFDGSTTKTDSIIWKIYLSQKIQL